MNSMTGFGKAELKTKVGRLTAEISSVNNRFLEISQRLPRQFFILEPKIRELIAGKLSRGKISLYIGFDEENGLSVRPLINKKTAKAYYQQLVQLKKELKLAGEITINDLLLLPELARPEDEMIDERTVWPSVKKVVLKALTDLLTMRRKEGLAMAADMKKRMSVLDRQVKKIQKRAPLSVENYRTKLNRRLAELLDNPVPDYIKVEEQVALMAEKTDITEECTRFLSHIEQGNSALKENRPIGKKLNFILQELNREANTIASKSTDVKISELVITIKEEIEKIREMVQNVE